MSKNFSKFDENINLLNLRDSVNPQVKETLKTKAKTTPRHIIIKLSKGSDKEKILKRGKKITPGVQRNKGESENSFLLGTNFSEKMMHQPL